MYSIEDYKAINKPENMIVTKHSRQRLAEKNITIREISMAISNGEIIEQYTDDYPFPSCLIRGIADNKVLHIVTSVSDEIMYVITAYIPDALRWDHEFRIRKEVDL